MKRAICLASACLCLLAGLAPAAPIATDTLTSHGYPAGLNDGSVFVGFSTYTSSTYGNTFAAWCIVKGVPQVPRGNTFDANIFLLDDPDLWSLLGGTEQQFRTMAWLGAGFDNTSPNDQMRHHAIWEQLRPALINLTLDEQALADAATIFSSDPNFLVTNFRVAVPVGWGTALSVGQPIMFEGGYVGGEEATIPEPGSMALLSGGLLLVALRRRR